MEKLKITLILLVFVILNSACTTIKILNVNKEVDFSLSDYETYDFYHIDIDTTAFPEYNKRFLWLEDELMKQLAVNGLKRSTTNPDLLINIGIVLDKKVQTRETDFLTDAQFMYVRNYKWESQEIAIGEYYDSTFAIDFVDSKDNALKCMAVGDAVLVKKDKNVKKNIEVGLNKLFKKINKD